MRNFIIFSLLLFIPVFLFADGIDDLIRKSGTAKEFPDARQLVIYDSTRVVVKESGLGLFYTHRLHKVLTVKGALELNVIKIDYDPLTAYAEIQKVVIHRKDGRHDELDVSKVVDYVAPARAIYWGASEKMIGVGRLEPGDAVEVFLFKKGFTYALLRGDDDEQYVPPMRGHFYDIVPFYAEYPILEKVYIVDIPKSKNLQYKFYHGEVNSSVTTTGDNAVFTFSRLNNLPLKRESGMVDLSDVSPKLLLSTSPDWIAKSLWFYKVNEDFGSFVSTPEIHAKVVEILKGAKDESDSISRLTHWCADEIRYSGISMGKGEGFTLHTGDMTFKDRAGVCKDKAGLLVTMLRDAGFKSYPAMTMAGSRIENIPADQFNHCVTVVERRDGQYQLLDPTWVPFVRELWSSAEQQQNYLLGLPVGADLDTTAVSGPENHYLKITGFSEITKEGKLKGGFSIAAEGQSDASVRRLFTGGYKSQWKMLIEKELLKINPLAKITYLDFGDPYLYMVGPFSMQVQYEIPGYAIVSSEELIFTPLLASNIFKSAMGHLAFNSSMPSRKYPFRDRCSRLVELTETVKLPSAGELIHKPELTTVKEGAVQYSSSYTLTGQTLEMKQVISLGKRIYEAAEWPGFQKAVANQNKMADIPVVIKFK